MPPGKKIAKLSLSPGLEDMVLYLRDYVLSLVIPLIILLTFLIYFFPRHLKTVVKAFLALLLSNQ